ncbi:MAG: DUF359 domain-containing protein [Candidatus Anstonellales archaeon]
MEIKINEELRKVLASPFGSICDINNIIDFAQANNRNLVCVGDVVTLSCLDYGFKPFVAVFDFRNLRKEIREEDKARLKQTFRHIMQAKNNAGTFNKELLGIAKHLMLNGGALLIKGEEDIAGLAFMAYATKEHVITYGIKDKGPVFLLGENAKHISNYILSKMGIKDGH